MLLGRVSLLVGDDKGSVTQLFMVRDANNDHALHTIRSLKLGKRSAFYCPMCQR